MQLSVRHLRVAVAVGLAIAVAYPMVIVELPQPERAPRVLSAPPPAQYRIYLADWGHHTSIILPQPVAWQFGPANDQDAPFVEYAWGDRRYYMALHPGALAGLAALFLSGRSVAYVQGWRTPPDPSAWPGLSRYERTVDASQLRALAGTLAMAVDRSRQFPPVEGYAGRFYEGLRRYSWWYDCNRWTVAQLHRVGLARTGVGVVFARQVARRLRGFAVTASSSGRSRN